MNNYLIVDLESIPLAAALETPYPEADRPFPANYKSEEAISKWRAADRIAWQEGRVKEASLSPRLGRICALGWKRADRIESECLTASQEDGEAALLRQFWGLLTPDTCVVTFNGSFDLRFIVIRSLVNNVTPGNYSHVRDWFKRYTLWPHFDTRAALTGWDDRQSGKLHEWAAAFGIPVEDTCTGADIYDLAQRGEWETINHHCKSDVDTTDALYNRIKDMYA